MPWWSDWSPFRKKKPAPAPSTPQAPSGPPPKPPFPTALQPGQRPFSTGYKPGQHGDTYHSDAAFTPDEEYKFLYLEQRTDCRSSWIEAAQYNSSRQELTIWVQDNPKDYVIPDVDEKMATRFLHSTSKGMWWWTNRHRWHGG